MKKVFLLGTMLGVATTAFAFGGVFNHGSKSSTYKGGVDAIGVHFGGETSDSQTEEETCSADKKCGDGCCQGDNVCQQNESGEYQCCNEFYNECCSVGQTATHMQGPPLFECCTGTPYCPTRDADGNCVRDYNYCCENGEVYMYGRFSYGDGYGCCSGKVYKGEGGYGADQCCFDGEEPYCSVYDSDGNCTYASCYDKVQKEVKCAQQFGKH